MPSRFRVDAPFKPAGDQPKAIEQLVEGVQSGLAQQVLAGVTGSGKTNVMAWAVEQLQRPVLVLSPNKTLAAQLCAEFRRLLPDNAVEYFVSYYDYYQPEAYIARSDTYIEKDSSRNEEIDRMRHSTTQALIRIVSVTIRMRRALSLPASSPSCREAWGPKPTCRLRNRPGAPCAMPPVRASRAGVPAPGSQRRALVRFLTASQEPDQRTGQRASECAISAVQYSRP